MPYKQRVGGSNPSTPTDSLDSFEAFYFGLHVFVTPSQLLIAKVLQAGY